MSALVCDYSSRMTRFVGRCQAVVAQADDGYDTTLFDELRELVDELPDWGLPMPQFLFRTMIAGVLLWCVRRRGGDMHDRLAAVLLEFATGRTTPEACRIECLALIDCCYEAISGSGHVSSAHDATRRVLRVIDTRHCDAGLTLRQVSTEVNLSMSHVSRLLNQHLTCGFRAHVNRLRVANAEKLLRNPTLSIKQVAAAVGYRSTSQLDRHFRELHGTTPASFRRNAKLPTRTYGQAAAALRSSATPQRLRRSNAAD